MVREVSRNLMVTLTELQSSSVEKGETSGRTSISAEIHQSGLYGRVARRKLLVSKRHMTARVKFSKRHLKDSLTLGLNAKRHVWRKPGTIHTVKHCGGRIMLRGCFSVGGTGRLVRIEAKMN